MSSEIVSLETPCTINLTTTNENTPQRIRSDTNDTSMLNPWVPQRNCSFTTLGSLNTEALINRKDPVQKSVISIKSILLFALFICISMITAIIIVCLTYPKQSYRCIPTYKLTVASTIGYNSRPRSIALEDFNHDNKLDVVVANSGKDNIGIFIQNTNGTFQNQITYSTNS
ncbi:unnamed protein product, partial [Adineta steineri]